MQMEFKKGDGQTHYFSLPEGSWSPGGLLWFAAKTIPDNDATDAAAVINKSFDDTKIVSPSHEEYASGFVTYELEFLPGDIMGVNFNNGESSLEYLGEFQFVPTTGIPESFPTNNEYIGVVIYADIKRGTS